MDNDKLDAMFAQQQGFAGRGDIRSDSTPYYIHGLERTLNRIEYKLDKLLEQPPPHK